MTPRRHLAGGMAWNLVGEALPLAAAVVAIPVLMGRMGRSGFGLLTFVWMIAGYSAVLDLGVGRALTHGIAERRGRSALDEIPAVVRAGLGLLALVGLAGFALLAGASGWVAGGFLEIPRELVPEAERALLVAALMVPMVVLASGLRGVLEAYQRFREIAFVRGATGVLFFAAPAIAFHLSPRLSVAVAALAAARALELVCYAGYAVALVPGLARRARGAPGLLRSLLRFGVWSTLNNLVGSLMAMAYIDRLFISGSLGTDTLAVFATPFDMVAKVLIAPAAIIAVLFPEFSKLGPAAAGAARAIALQSLRLVAFGTAPLLLLLVATAEPLLALWLGADFAARSAVVLQLAAAGTLAVSMAYVPFAFVQAMGRPDLTAKRHFAELPFYLAASFVAVRTLGAAGGAVVWCAWAAIDLALMLGIMRRVEPGGGPAASLRGLGPLAALLAAAFVAGRTGEPWLQVAAGALVPAVFLAWAWGRWLRPEDRDLLSAWIPARVRERVGGKGGPP